jgi:hypothetical protein
MKKILYIGSGISALDCNDPKYENYTKVAANNAWRLFENKRFDIWIHSGDFPRECFPSIKNYDTEVYTEHYGKSAEKAAKILNWDTKSPQHYAGYTIFFLGLYYIMMELEPSEIGLLGFDHDYNPEKLKKWHMDDRPNLQNRFNNKKEPTIEEWSRNYFKDMDADFFYGHGTPDPMRLGDKYILDKMDIAKESAKTLGIKIHNFSKRDSKLTTFEYGCP